MTDDFLQTVHTYLTQILAHLLCQESKVVDHILGTSLKVLAQLRVLRRHTHRTGIGITLAHHHTAQHNQRQRTERELVSTQHRHDDDVLGCLQLTVGLQAHLIAQAVHHQCLLRLCQTYLG